MWGKISIPIIFLFLKPHPRHRNNRKFLPTEFSTLKIIIVIIENYKDFFYSCINEPLVKIWSTVVIDNVLRAKQL